jgi:penicillin-binding protein 1A
VRALVRLLAVIVLAGLGLAGAVAAMTPQVTAIASAFDGEAPALPDFAPLAQRSLVFDATGKEIDQLYVENREPFTLAQVPPDVVDAVLAVEDAGFFAHRGVNAKGILRAVLRNLSAASTTQGGSTITQQLVKNAFTGAERNADRKIQEAVLAVRLEQEFSKEFILERYLNTVYFGNNAYGLEAAAETYFSKSVTELSLGEGAFLAGLIQNPVGSARWATGSWPSAN